MKKLLLPWGLFLWIVGCAFAQTPAQPADPNQARPAVPLVPTTPVAPDGAPVVPVSPAATAVPSVSIIADSSLKTVLQELAQTWADAQATNPQVPLTLTNAGTLRAKIEAGGGWDLALIADGDDAKALTDRGFLLAAGQRSLARNALALVGRAPLVKDDELDWFDLVGTEWKKVALGNPALTASGRVARRALQQHNLINDDTKNVFVNAPNETAALQVALRQKADAVFVFKTDLASASLPGFQVFPLGTNDAPPVFYTVALFRLAKNPDLAQAFLSYCTSEAARSIWTKYGFETN